MPHITTYAPGDVLTRIHTVNGDHSFLGHPGFFLGITNNHIYIVSLDEEYGKGKLRFYNMDAYADGWDRWNEPMSLFTEELLERLLERIRHQNAVEHAQKEPERSHAAQQLMMSMLSK